MARLTFDLHILTLHMDRHADRILKQSLGLGYRRFLTLVLIGERGPLTQRELADAQGLTEPATSRMVAALTTDGLVSQTRTPGSGHRHAVALTDSGTRLVESAAQILEAEFATIVRASGVDAAAYQRDTRALIAAITTPGA